MNILGTDEVFDEQQQCEVERQMQQQLSENDDEVSVMPQEGVDIPFSDAEREAQHRRMALSCIERQVAQAWSALPDRYKTDKEFILTTLHRFQTLPSKADFERRFPQWLRFDRDVVLAFCARSDFEQLYYERLLHVPHVLTGDKQVMLAYCRHIPRSLQNCSEELTDDVDVVKAAIVRDGMELQYASRRLQADKELVMLACQTAGRALEFCPPGPVRDELVSDKSFMLDVMRKHGGPMLKLVSTALRHDSELLLEALKHGMPFRYVPYEHQFDAEFLQEAFKTRADVYLELPKCSQSRPELALAAITAFSSKHAVITKALDLLPSLRDLRPVALAVSKHAETTMLENYFAPPNALYRDDKEVMLEAVKRHVSLFSIESVLSPRLLQDVDIILSAMDMSTAPDVLRVLSASFLEQNPIVALTAVRVASPRSLRSLRPHIPDVLWRQDRDLAIAWIRRGCRVLDPFERLLRNDEEFCLEVAEHSWLDFGRVAEHLRSDRTFMTKAVDRNGRVLRWGATEAIRDNLNLAVRAVASHYDALNTPSIRLDKAALKRHVQERLDVHDVFVNEFLRGISTCTQSHLPPAKRCPLPLLDRGEETSQALKRLIGLFLGVLTGPDLKLYRTAWKNLTTDPPVVPKNNNDDNSDNTHPFLVRNGWPQRGGDAEDMLIDAGDMGPFDMFEDHEDFVLERMLGPAALREHRFAARRRFLQHRRRREQLWREAGGQGAGGPAAAGAAARMPVGALRQAPPPRGPGPVVEAAAARRLLRIHQHVPGGEPVAEGPRWARRPWHGLLPPPQQGRAERFEDEHVNVVFVANRNAAMERQQEAAGNADNDNNANPRPAAPHRLNWFQGPNFRFWRGMEGRGQDNNDREGGDENDDEMSMIMFEQRQRGPAPPAIPHDGDDGNNNRAEAWGGAPQQPQPVADQHIRRFGFYQHLRRDREDFEEDIERVRNNNDAVPGDPDREENDMGFWDLVADLI